MVQTSIPIALRILAVSLALAAGKLSAAGAETIEPVIGRYDFRYVIKGEPGARPVQAFDNGERTYFQFQPDRPVPVIMVAEGQTMLEPQREGPYVVVASRARDFVLVLGRARATVLHVDVASGAQPRATAAAASAQSPTAPGTYMQPPRHDAGDATTSSFATPVRGDVVEWSLPGPIREQPVLFALGKADLSSSARRRIAFLATHIQPGTRVTVLGRDDPSQKDGLAEQRAYALRNALIAAGMPQEAVSAEIGVGMGEQIAASQGQDHKGSGTYYASTIRWTETRPLRTLATDRRARMAANAVVRPSRLRPLEP